MVPLRYLGLGSATTTPERVVVLGFRAIPNSVNRTRSPSWNSRSIFLGFLDISIDDHKWRQQTLGLFNCSATQRSFPAALSAAKRAD